MVSSLITHVISLMPCVRVLAGTCNGAAYILIIPRPAPPLAVLHMMFRGGGSNGFAHASCLLMRDCIIMQDGNNS